MTTTTRRLGASAIALALATTSVAAPSAFAQESDVAEIASGNVNWPIKESFNRYINMPLQPAPSMPKMLTTWQRKTPSTGPSTQPNPNLMQMEMAPCSSTAPSTTKLTTVGWT